jgi:peptide/nickel transport system permease protein
MPRNLRGGLLLLAMLGALALAAPLLATDLPWVARDDAGLSFPALRGLISPAHRTGGIHEGRIVSAPIPHGPNDVDLGAALLAPTGDHWLGTDDLGRDLAARVVHGARVSLGVGLLAALFALVVGVPLGAWAGYRGGWADFLVSRAVETVLSFPTLLLVLAILAVATGWLASMSDVTRIALVLGLTGWMPIARYLRAEFLKLRESDRVVAARSVGGGDLRIVGRHILPSAVAPVLVTAAFAVGAAIGLEAALSFLGLGVRPPHATWGVLLADAREQIDRAWWLATFPGFALFLAILACNLVGEGIRDLLDPRSARR